MPLAGHRIGETAQLWHLSHLPCAIAALSISGTCPDCRLPLPGAAVALSESFLPPELRARPFFNLRTQILSHNLAPVTEALTFLNSERISELTPAEAGSILLELVRIFSDDDSGIINLEVPVYHAYRAMVSRLLLVKGHEMDPTIARMPREDGWITATPEESSVRRAMRYIPNLDKARFLTPDWITQATPTLFVFLLDELSTDLLTPTDEILRLIRLPAFAAIPGAEMGTFFSNAGIHHPAVCEEILDSPQFADIPYADKVKCFASCKENPDGAQLISHFTAAPAFQRLSFENYATLLMTFHNEGKSNFFSQLLKAIPLSYLPAICYFCNFSTRIAIAKAHAAPLATTGITLASVTAWYFLASEETP